MNPVILCEFYFHLINRIMNTLRSKQCSLAHISRLRNRSFCLSISAPIVQRSSSPRAAEPDVPPSNPRHTLTNAFCNHFVWLSTRSSAPYNIFGRAIRFLSLVAKTGLIQLNLHPVFARRIPMAYPALAASSIGMRLLTFTSEIMPNIFSAIALPPSYLPVCSCRRVISFLTKGQHNSFVLIKAKSSFQGILMM